MPTKRPSEEEIQSQLCTANRILAHEGILNGFGHVTARVTGESRVLVSVAQSPILVRPGDVVSVSLDGQVSDTTEREMYSELPLHLAIYRHRPDVNSVVHHHAPEIMPFACTDCEIRPMGKVGRTFADGVPRFDDYDLEQRGRLVVDRDESDRMAINLGAHSAQLLDGHGANVVGSTIARETDAGVYLHAGPEIGVASTKAFTGQVTVLAMMALMLGRERNAIGDEEMARYLQALTALPDKIREVLKMNDELLDLSRIYRYAQNFLYMGRGVNFPVALEGALKLKEISYIHAEGYPAAEMKHGPIALIDPHMPVVVIAMKDRTYEKVVSNIEEVVARKGSVIAITDHEGEELDELCEHVIRVPSTEPFLMPLLTVIPLQLLSYHIAVMRECDVDQPRNLAKSVTVE
jgi:ribulose-5-phosphate 4-epimerase/fuculose-1-phosphate aldolase